MSQIAPSAPVDSLLEGVAEVFAAGQDLLVDRIGLLRAELSADVTRAAARGAVLASAAVLLLLGWTLFCAAAAVLVHRWLPLDAALGAVGALNLVLGFAGLQAARTVPAPEAPHV